MKNRVTAIIAVLVPFTIFANPAEETVRLAANNAGHEMIECAAYFGIAAQGMRQTPGEQMQATAKLYEETMSNAITYALHYAELIGQKPEAVQARMKLAMEEMLDAMGRDYINVSILIDKYAKPCQTAMEDPAARLEYWLTKTGQ